ncbi:hypothetical protein [Nocardioides sp. zg-DK7169]|uniref:hypothetical protein n=1 Tax=Nocardioides sp. zg-DK7169 TaxID=2736600 RepID=UPI0020A698BF|nr:hypothetical protein [Nocardioides sp. zg-DK7169]
MDEHARTGAETLQVRIAMGAAVGITAGVVLFLWTDSWAVIGLAVVLGLLVAALPPGRGRTGPAEDGTPDGD